MATHQSHCDIDVTRKDINMDINICMKVSYFDFSDFTVKCIQSKAIYTLQKRNATCEKI